MSWCFWLAVLKWCWWQLFSILFKIFICCAMVDVHASFDLLLVIKERFIQLMSFIVLFDKDVFVLWSHGEITCLVTSHHLYIVIVLCKASM
jgi:hypothetical protein